MNEKQSQASLSSQLAKSKLGPYSSSQVGRLLTI